MSKSQIPSQKFVLTWMEAYKRSRNQQWVADKLGVTRQNVSQRGRTNHAK